jgi:membrane associated rhomboid family serine protease
MSTSGGGTVNAVLYVVMVGLTVQLGMLLLAGRRVRPWPRSQLILTGAGLWLLVAVPSVLQNPFPALLTSLRRDPELIRHHGQYWRILTSVAVQDGGVPGTVWNLAILAVVVVVAVQVWGPLRTAIVFLVAQLLFNTLAVFLSSDLGAGNSGATFGLACSMAGLGLLRRRNRAVLPRALGVLGIGVALLVIGDAHGIAVLGGVLIGLLATAITGQAGEVWQTRYHHVPG